VPETPEELYERVKDGLRMPPVDEWETFPFDGELRARPLQPPVAEEEPRKGIGGVDCYHCAKGDLVWHDEHWKAWALGPTGLPMIVILVPREHYDIDELPAELAAALGPLMQRIERAIHAIGDIGRVHICRWGDGSEHLHWWFMARPARVPQLIGSFAAVWDEILPPVPEDVWQANVAAVAAALRE
jgi:diadenosine tetraphosphate (Ap4A) HIT family hydrolase